MAHAVWQGLLDQDQRYPSYRDGEVSVVKALLLLPESGLPRVCQPEAAALENTIPGGKGCCLPILDTSFHDGRPRDLAGRICAPDATPPVIDMFRMTAAVHYRSPNNSKYRSRDIRAVRKLFLMTNTGTAAYLGITTGRITPDFVNTIWSPSIRTHRNPSPSKTLTSCLYETGLNFDMNERKGHRYPLQTY